MPGYDAKTVEPLKAALVCPECNLLLRDAVQTGDGIRLCETCFKQFQEYPNHTSPKSGMTVGKDYYPDKAVRREIFQLIVLCLHSIFGCPWQGQLQHFEGHCRSCKYKPMKCPNPGCSELMPAEKLDNHVDGDCPFRKVACDHCREETMAKQLEDHLSQCPKVPVKCERCSERVARDAMKEHQQRDCPYVECPAPGCGEIAGYPHGDTGISVGGRYGDEGGGLEMLFFPPHCSHGGTGTSVGGLYRDKGGGPETMFSQAGYSRGGTGTLVGLYGDKGGGTSVGGLYRDEGGDTSVGGLYHDEGGDTSVGGLYRDKGGGSETMFSQAGYSRCGTGTSVDGLYGDKGGGTSVGGLYRDEGGGTSLGGLCSANGDEGGCFGASGSLASFAHSVNSNKVEDSRAVVSDALEDFRSTFISAVDPDYFKDKISTTLGEALNPLVSHLCSQPSSRVQFGRMKYEPVDDPSDRSECPEAFIASFILHHMKEKHHLSKYADFFGYDKEREFRRDVEKLLRLLQNNKKTASVPSQWEQLCTSLGVIINFLTEMEAGLLRNNETRLAEKVGGKIDEFQKMKSEIDLLCGQINADC